MCLCWQHSPDDRPSFGDLVGRIDKLLDDRTNEVMSDELRKANEKSYFLHQSREEQTAR